MDDDTIRFSTNDLRVVACKWKDNGACLRQQPLGYWTKAVHEYASSVVIKAKVRSLSDILLIDLKKNKSVETNLCE
jgi:hypothetical protein